jgi:hypothetical protein
MDLRTLDGRLRRLTAQRSADSRLEWTRSQRKGVVREPRTSCLGTVRSQSAQRSLARGTRVAPCRVDLVVEHCGSFRVKLGVERLRHLLSGEVTIERAENWVGRKRLLLTAFTPPEKHEWRLGLGADGGAIDPGARTPSF